MNREALGQFDILITLGGGMEQKNNHAVLSRVSKMRALAAAQVIAENERNSPTDLLVILSGGCTMPGFPGAEATLMYDYLLSHTETPSHVDVLMEPDSLSTADNLRNVRVALEKREIEPRTQRIGLITNAFHLPRAEHYARRNGLKVTLLPAEMLLARRSAHFLPIMESVEKGKGRRLEEWRELIAIALLGLDPDGHIPSLIRQSKLK